MTTQSNIVPRFTPGPWVAKASHEKHPRHGIFSHEGTVILARAWTAEDANLIAAAPELYEALEAAIFGLEKHGFPESAALLKPALAKARGEQP